MLEILSTHSWLLESKYFALIKPVMLAKLERGDIDFDRALILTSDRRLERYGKEDGLPDMIIVGAGDSGISAAEMAASRANTVSSGGNVAVIPLQGTMMKNSGYCSRGTKDIIKMIDQANADPNISAMVMDTDSPGGAVDGTERLGQVINSSPKPIVGFVDGIGASGAYWAISQTKHIIINSETTGYVGSIGVIAMAMDQSSWLEKNGVKVNVIRSTKATDKALLNGYEPITEEIIADYRKQMDIIHETFIATVRAGRGSKIGDAEDIFTGKVYNGKEAKKKGLVDGIGTLEDAVNKAAQIARQQSKITLHSNANQTFSNMKFPKLSALFGYDAKITDGSVVTEANMATAEAAITERDQQISDLTAKVTQLESKVNTQESTIAQHETTISTQAEEIKTLEGWREQAKAKNGKQDDELNSVHTGNTQPKAAFEIAAEKAREKAKIRK